MKKLLAILAMVAACTATTVAAEFSDYTAYYDFEDYNVTYGTGAGPDSNWGYASMKSGASYIPSEKRKVFGNVKDSETGSMVMSAKNIGEPVLKFGELRAEGKFHVSFDIKPVNIGNECYVGFYDGNNKLTGATEMEESTYAIGPWFKKDGKIYYSYSGKKNGNDMRWTQHWMPIKDTGKTFENGKWYHIDMYFEDYGDVNTALAYYYLDGELMNENPVYFKTCNGFKGMYFRTSGSTEIYIDNLYIRNFKGTENLVGVLENDLVERENSTLTVRLLEPASAVVTKEDVIITSNTDGSEITDFEVTSNSNRIINIKINSGLGSGRYTVKLKDSVVGSYYGTPMAEGLVFRTPPKQVDGVDCPDVEAVNFYHCNGSKQTLNGGISTATEKIEVKFTTSVSEENIDEAVTLEQDGEIKTYAYILKDEGKTLEMYPIGLLLAASNYKVTVTTEVAAAENTDAKMESPYIVEFTTLDDAKYEVVANGVKKEGNEATFPVQIIKTNNEAHKYTYAVAAYKQHMVTDENGNNKIYYEMTELSRFPVIIDEPDAGNHVFDCNTPLDITGASFVKGFLWNYPDNLAVVEKQTSIK